MKNPATKKNDISEVRLPSGSVAYLERSEKGGRGRAWIEDENGRAKSFLPSDMPDDGTWVGPVGYVCGWGKWDTTRRAFWRVVAEEKSFL